MSQGFVKPSSVGKGHDTRHCTQYDGRLPVSCLEYEYVSISPPLRCSFVAEYAVSPLGCVCVSMDRHHFSATGETLHKHKFAFNASLLRFVKRTLERIPCFVVFFLLFFASLRYSLVRGADDVIVVPVVVCFQTTVAAA